MSARKIIILSVLVLTCIPNLTAQDISVEVFVYNHYTYAPLDSALVKLIRDEVVVDSSYTGKDGRTQFIIQVTSVEEGQSGIPTTFTVSENYPNPFRDETQVDFLIPKFQTVRTDVYNILGQRVLSEDVPLSAGYYSMKLSLSHLSTGVYFLRLRGMEQRVIKLMKIGGGMHYNAELLGSGTIQVTPRSGINLPLYKNTSEENGEYTIEVEKDWYARQSVTKKIESDTEIHVPLELLPEHLLEDVDGNLYQTVKIGNYIWMAENLRVTRYRSGRGIPTGLGNPAWETTTSGAYTVYPHDDVDGIDSEEEMVAAYGMLYNWHAVADTGGLCPAGWHIPSAAEWRELEIHLGMTEEEADEAGFRGRSANVGGKMKSTLTEPDPHPRWGSPNKGATNESGFSGLPGSLRNNIGNYFVYGVQGMWWSSTELGWTTIGAWYWSLDCYDITIGSLSGNKLFGLSVRCIKEAGTINDIDGNVYRTVQIGEQWWMAENLRTTRYRNGDAIPTIVDKTEWGTTTTGAYAVAPHDAVDGIHSEEEMVATYGILYNWYAVNDSSGLCPTGWHIPSDAEWTILVDYLGGEDVAGGKMKSTRTEPDAHPRWKSPNGDATNESGFSALPDFGRTYEGDFAPLGVGGSWPSSTEYSDDLIHARSLSFYWGKVNNAHTTKWFGHSVRCLRDE